MTKGRAAMWAKARTLGAALFALGLAAACGKTNDTESGETHFVKCDTDADCADVTGSHTCSGGLCRNPSNGSSGAANGSDQAACDGSCGNSECATPGNCTLAAACQLVDCGGVQVDDNACVRPSCESDDDCANDERCTSLYSGKQYQCEQKGAVCDCTAGLGLFPLHLCSPVTKAGERGSWDQLVVSDTVIGMETRHVFTPDGHVEATFPAGEEPSPLPPTTLSASDADALEHLVNGPQLRLALANPSECPLTKSRDVIVQLYLHGSGSPSVTPIEKNVAGCLGGTSEVPAFSQLLDLTNQY